MKNAVFWDVTKVTRRYIPEDGILQLKPVGMLMITFSKLIYLKKIWDIKTKL
jgi:hypothetical protein